MIATEEKIEVSLKERVFSVVVAAPGQTSRQIADYLEADYACVRAELHKLKKAGRITSTQDGEFDAFRYWIEAPTLEFKESKVLVRIGQAVLLGLSGLVGFGAGLQNDLIIAGLSIFTAGTLWSILTR